MDIENELIRNKLIPLSKYWSLRLGFLDIINSTSLFIPLIEGREDLGDDGKKMIIISKEWKTKNEHNVGEGGALFRYLQFTSWKFNLGKKFIKEGTLKNREICDNPEIVNWPINKLLQLDNKTPQWASVAILLGNKEKIPNDYFLKLSKEALAHYKHIKNKGGFCEIQYDETLLSQARAFIDILTTGKSNYEPLQQDEYCFARAFEIIDKYQGEKLWPELRGHESDRIEEMENMIKKLENSEIIESKDHRVVQAIALLAMKERKRADFANPSCVNKSWPQFWKFLEFIKENYSEK